MVACEMIDILIPIRHIERVYPGGFAGYCEDYRGAFGGRLWHDGVLLRDGAMGAPGAKHVVEFWESFGLVGIVERDGGRAWQDICVHDWMYGGATLPCDWLRSHDRLAGVYHVGFESAPLVSRAVMRAALVDCRSGADIAGLFGGVR